MAETQAELYETSAGTSGTNHYVYEDEDVPFTHIGYLGHGSYGTVDTVRRSASPSSETYARKVFIFPRTPKKGEMSTILREVSISTRLRHDHIVRLVQTYETSRLYAIVMSPVAEGNLKQYFSTVYEQGGHERRDRLPQWFGCLINAVDYLHKKGIHHRDIKPENILTKGENVLLTDFGISKEFQEKTRSGSTETLGTRTYRSPEHWDGHRPGRRADIFSLGAVFLEMLIVYSGPGGLEKFIKSRNGPYYWNMSRVSEWIEMLEGTMLHDMPWFSTMLFLCRSMLDKDESSRPYANSLRLCWVYQPYSEVPPTPAFCKCYQISKNFRAYRFKGIDEVLLQAASAGNELVVDLLIRNGAKTSTLNCCGQTPLLAAAKNGHEAVVKLLVKFTDADVDWYDCDGRTPLSLAAGNGHEAVVRFLLGWDNADINSEDKDERTPLSWAAGNGFEKVVKTLLVHPEVDVNTKDCNLRAPLSWAAANGQDAVVRVLVEHPGVDVNIMDSDGRTPLSWAAGNGHEALVRVLVEHPDVDMNTKDIDGRTPMSWAVKNGHEAVGELWAALAGWMSIDTLKESEGGLHVDEKIESVPVPGEGPLTWTAGLYRQEQTARIIPGQAGSPSRLAFYDLSDEPRHLSPTGGSYWRHLTVEALSIYSDIYEACRKDQYGNVHYSAFLQQFRFPEPHPERIQAVWLRFKRPLNEPLQKNFVLATLYMLHVEKYLNETPTDSFGDVGIARERLKSLNRFSLWVICACNIGCGTSWNFSNDLGLSQASSGGECKVIKWLELDELERQKDTGGLQAYRRAVKRWKRLDTTPLVIADD